MSETTRLNATNQGISGSTLKLIAIFTMLIDHIGATIIERGIWGQLVVGGLSSASGGWYTLDLVCRFGFGRIAFPIFCFLLTEGFFNTRNRKQYALRLGLFSLVSELPYDLAFFGAFFDWTMQNVFFTLCIGFCTIWGMETLRRKAWKPALTWAAMLAVLLAGAALAHYLRTDYGAFGVLFIALFYLFRTGAEWKRNLVCGIACAWEVTAPLALIPIHFYNGSRGLRLKYVFYLFYPVHLLLLALVTELMLRT